MKSITKIILALSIVGFLIVGYLFIKNSFPGIFRVLSLLPTTVSEINYLPEEGIAPEELTRVKLILIRHEYKLGESRIDSISASEGGTSVSIRQYKNALPVFGQPISMHFNADGSYKMVDGKPYISGDVVPDTVMGAKPTVTPLEAVRSIRRKMLFGGAESPSFSYELGYYKRSNLAYYSIVYFIKPTDQAYPEAYVDANSGELLYFFDGIMQNQ